MKLVLIAGLFCGVVGLAAEPMPVAQQNALVMKYCAVCHTDTVRNGGLSLQHFDAAQAAPSLMAMLLSKLRGGALGAAGIKPPDAATEESLRNTFASAARTAAEWHLSRGGEAAVVTASILRELPMANKPDELRSYRIAVSCDSASHQGEVQVAWSPVPATGTVSVSLDGRAGELYEVQGREKMGNGNPITTGPASVFLKPRLPKQTLTFSGLFAGESVTFPFSELTPSARQSLAGCFSGD